MIHAISGKPRNGKSLYAMRLVLNEILHGHRPVFTNLPVKLPELNAYLQKNFPVQFQRRTEEAPFSKERPAHISDIVVLLSDEQIQNFWTWRPAADGVGFLRIEQLTKEEWKAGKKPSYAAVQDRGVFYVIDECHNYFSARAWAETGRDCFFYLSQHGHLSDTVVWVTQAVANVDKQFRSVTQDFTYLRNLTKEKMGLFRLPGMFVRKTYSQPATDTTAPMETGTFKLDVSGLASLYSTVAGVGIHDRGNADMGEKKKGFHWLWPVILIPLFLVLVAKFVPHIIGEMFNPMKHLTLPLDRGQSAPVISHSAVSNRVAGGPVNAGGDLLQESRVQTNVVYMTSYMVVPISRFGGRVLDGKKVTVNLSDGTILHSGDGRLQYLCEDYCVADGRTNWARINSPLVVSNPDIGVDRNQNQVVTPQPVGTLSQAYQDSGSGSSLYIIPHHVNSMSHPSVRSSVSGVGGNLGGNSYQQSY